MRKWFIAMLILTGIFFVPACSVSYRTENEVLKQEEEETENSEGYITVGFSQVGSESDWRAANTQSFLDTFTAENGYYLLYEDAQNKQENQLKAVRSFILQEVDCLFTLTRRWRPAGIRFCKRQRMQEFRLSCQTVRWL